MSPQERGGDRDHRRSPQRLATCSCRDDLAFRSRGTMPSSIGARAAGTPTRSCSKPRRASSAALSDRGAAGIPADPAWRGQRWRAAPRRRRFYRPTVRPSFPLEFADAAYRYVFAFTDSQHIHPPQRQRRGSIFGPAGIPSGHAGAGRSIGRNCRRCGHPPAQRARRSTDVSSED